MCINQTMKIWQSKGKLTIYYKSIDHNTIILSLEYMIDTDQEMKLFFKSITNFLAQYQFVILNLSKLKYANSLILSSFCIINEILENIGGRLFIIDDMDIRLLELLEILDIRKFFYINKLENILDDIYRIKNFQKLQTKEKELKKIADKSLQIWLEKLRKNWVCVENDWFEPFHKFIEANLL